MYTIGIDEAGRGALAGPVVVAAILVPKAFYPKGVKLPKLRDSKHLSPIQRRIWFNYLKLHPQIIYSTARVYPRRIEKINIAKAADLAAERSLTSLLSKLAMENLRLKTIRSILLDGSLYLHSRFSIGQVRTVIRGDEKLVPIKLASIVAKVTRDSYMIKLHQRYPSYHFNLHKGYGTTLHRKLIGRHGPAEVHRLTYLRNYPRVRT